MSIVDLSRRLTADEKAYRAALQSDCSLVMVTPLPHADLCEPASIDLSVGERLFDADVGKPLSIPSDGLTLRPAQAVVIYTRERLCLPYNVFGLLSGKGTLIYNGLFISQGKIDPGYQDHLRVGLLNGSRRPLQLRQGQPICSCTFFQMETHLVNPLARHGTEPAQQLFPKLHKRIIAFCAEHWKWLLTTLIALIAAAAAVMRLQYPPPP